MLPLALANNDILEILFIILMILSAIGVGAGWMYAENPRVRGVSGFLLWICVAILGWVIFGNR